MPFRSFYVKKDDLLEWDRLKQIARRENRAVGRIIMELLTEYIRVHEPGNPQQRIDTILELGKAYNATGCFECGKKPFVLATRGKRQLLLCRFDFERLKHKLEGWKEL